MNGWWMDGYSGKSLGLPVYIPGHGALLHLPLESGQTIPRSEGPSWQNSTAGWGPPSV